MNSCPDEVTLSRFFDGEDSGEYAEHVASCLQCRQVLRELGELETALTAPVQKSAHHSRRSVRWLSGAAILLLSLGLFWKDSTESRIVEISTGRSYSVSVNGGILLSLEIDGESIVKE